MKKVIWMFIFLIVVGALSYVFLFKKDNVKNPNPNDNPNNNQNNEKPKPEEPLTYLDKIIYTVSIDKEAEKTIVEYFDLYYKSIKKLEALDMSDLFIDEEQSYINKTAVELLVGIRKLQSTDLTMSKTSYDLDFKEVTSSNGDLKVVLRETSHLNFNFMDRESTVYNIKNEFTLRKVNDEYKIVEYNKVQDFFVMITEYYDGDGKEELDALKTKYLSLTDKKVEDLKKDYQDYLNGTGIARKTCDNGYNREAAVAYSNKYINTRNSDWSDFSNGGGNCQNHASQTLLAGGIPMDPYGSQWKFYSSSYNPSEGASGYNYAWTSVGYFQDYVNDNTGYGLCADIDVSWYYGEPGDLIDMGVTRPDRHIVVVRDIVKKDGKVVDLLVNSNTVDLENYPMTAYVYPYNALIKIYGFNN